MKRFFLIGTLAIFMGSCTSIYFEEPQPRFKETLSEFPSNVRGTYVMENDTISIKEREYDYPELFERSFSLDEIDSFPEIKFEGELLFDETLPVKTGVKFNINNDTVEYSVKLKLTKPLSEKLILKSHGDYLVLSEENEDVKGHWEVFLIKKMKGGDLELLTVGNFKPEGIEESNQSFDGDLKDYTAITPFTEIGNRKYMINPTPKELNQLIKKKFFVRLGDLKRLKD